MPTNWSDLAQTAATARQQHLTGDTPDALLAELRRGGFSLQLEGDRLLVGPAGKLTADLAQRITRHKAGLLALLTQPATPAVPAEPWDAEKADVWLREHLANLESLTVLATTRSRQRIVATERELLTRWHREHNPLLWTALEVQQYLLRLWAAVPGREEEEKGNG